MIARYFSCNFLLYFLKLEKNDFQIRLPDGQSLKQHKSLFDLMLPNFEKLEFEQKIKKSGQKKISSVQLQNTLNFETS